jgi:hypothetical protein
MQNKKGGQKCRDAAVHPFVTLDVENVSGGRNHSLNCVVPYDPDKHDRQSIRLPGWDYRRPGAYFVTVCAHERQCLFGAVADGRMALNAYGRIVAEEWNRSPSIREEIETDAFVVMPNHLHDIVIIAPPDTPRPITPDGYNVHVDTNHGENHVGTHGRASLQRRSKSGRPARRSGRVGIMNASSATNGNGTPCGGTSTGIRRGGIGTGIVRGGEAGGATPTRWIGRGATMWAGGVAMPSGADHALPAEFGKLKLCLHVPQQVLQTSQV